MNFLLHCPPSTDVLGDLAPYVYRVAIPDRNILKVKDGKVTFRYKDSTDDSYKLCTLNAFEFLRRFLQHALPKGFVKVRYYSFLATRKRKAFLLENGHYRSIPLQLLYVMCDLLHIYKISNHSKKLKNHFLRPGLFL